jgi:protein-glucosylgalactosylhydroxylysine glucosidase
VLTVYALAPGSQMLNGSTTIPEVVGGPLTAVCVVSTPVPASISVTASTTLIFLTAMRSSLDSGNCVADALQDYKGAARQAKSGDLYSRHTSAWSELWESGFEIEGRDDVAVAVNASIFAILSSVRDDWPYSLGPGGLTDGFAGHTFWDVESWVYPPTLLWFPGVAASLLQYRFDRVPAARAKARGYPDHYK